MNNLNLLLSEMLFINRIPFQVECFNLRTERENNLPQDLFLAILPVTYFLSSSLSPLSIQLLFRRRRRIVAASIDSTYHTTLSNASELVEPPTHGGAALTILRAFHFITVINFLLFDLVANFLWQIK